MDWNWLLKELETIQDGCSSKDKKKHAAGLSVLCRLIADTRKAIKSKKMEAERERDRSCI